MIKITIEMLRKKIASHEARIEQIDRMIREREAERTTFLQEISSFKHSLKILENYDRGE